VVKKDSAKENKRRKVNEINETTCKKAETLREEEKKVCASFSHFSKATHLLVLSSNSRGPHHLLTSVRRKRTKILKIVLSSSRRLLMLKSKREKRKK
jgi:hypothetical protein